MRTNFIFLLVFSGFSATVFSQDSASLDEALKLYEKEEFSKALANVEKIIANEKDDFECWHLKGNCYQKEGKYNHAIQAYETAEKLSNASARLYANWASAHYNLEQMEAAEAKAKQALKINEALPEANYVMGNIKHFDFNLSAAIKYYNRAIDMKPEYRDALYMRAAAKAEKRDYPGALKDYLHVLEIDPSLEKARYNIGVIYLVNEEFEKSAQAFAEVNAEHLDKPVDYLFYKAEALYFDGKTEEACGLYKQAMELGDAESQEIYTKYCLEKAERPAAKTTRTIRATF